MKKFEKKNVFLLLIISLMLLKANIYIQTINKKQIIGELTIKEAFNKIQENKNNPNLVILDVRTPDEYSEGHIEKSVNIDFNANDFKTKINELDKNKTYLVYCRSGNRSSKAIKVMEQLGFKEAYNIGSIMNWQKEGYPVVK